MRSIRGHRWSYSTLRTNCPRR